MTGRPPIKEVGCPCGMGEKQPDIPGAFRSEVTKRVVPSSFLFLNLLIFGQNDVHICYHGKDWCD